MTNLANTYQKLGRVDEALRVRQEVYSGRLKLSGEEHGDTILAGLNYAASLVELQRFEEARSLTRKMMPVARRVLGEGDNLTLRMRWNYAQTLYYRGDSATLDELREAVETLADSERIARRVFGGTHPLTTWIEKALGESRDVLRERETPSLSPSESS